MRIVYLGSPPFALPILGTLLESDHELVALVTQPDRPKGRGRTLVRSPLAALAEEHGLATERILQPSTTKDASFVEALRSAQPEVLVVASYGEILREDVLELAPHGALNVHGSLLPRWRGASPVQRAILAGDSLTGVTIQRMVLALDRGDVLHTYETPIQAGETYGELLARLAEESGPVLLQALAMLAEDRAQFTPQDDELATYAPKLRKEDGWIDWQRPARELVNHVHGMNPWPGARTRLPEGRELVVLRTELRSAGQASQKAVEAGTVIASGGDFCVQSGDDLLVLHEIKPAGKGAMRGADFLRGARLPEGCRLQGPESVS